MLVSRLILALGLLSLTAAAPPPPPPPAEAPLRNPDVEGSSNLTNAAAAPLHDLNLARQEIPPILFDAMTDAYRRPLSIRCQDLAVEINKLTAVLGPDFDQPPPAGQSRRSHIGLAIVHGAAESLLPFNGYIRTLTGAQKHDQLVLEAITAGHTRRAYLRGVAEAHRCLPPVAPDHHMPNRPLAKDPTVGTIYKEK